MVKIVILFMVLAANLSDMVVTGAPNRMKRGDTIRVCGPMLVETLSMLCNGEYYDPNEVSSISKRSYGPQPNAIDPYPRWMSSAITAREQNDPGQAMPETPVRHGRYVRGVVDECCHRSCSIMTLLSYCRTA